MRRSLGFGGILARYASEGVTTALVTATRGDRGRLWARQYLYRVISTVNGGRARETDLFEGIPR